MNLPLIYIPVRTFNSGSSLWYDVSYSYFLYTSVNRLEVHRGPGVTYCTIIVVPIYGRKKSTHKEVEVVLLRTPTTPSHTHGIRVTVVSEVVHVHPPEKTVPRVGTTVTNKFLTDYCPFAYPQLSRTVPGIGIILGSTWSYRCNSSNNKPFFI